MSPATPFHVLVATDGSPEARAAVGAAVAFPWPRGARASGVVGRALLPAEIPRGSGLTLESTLEQLAEETSRALTARWPRATVSIVSGSAASAIVAEARRRHTRVIVLGAQGHGAVSRLLLGSVSRNVVRAAACAVLVVRGGPDRISNPIVGIDGSAQSRRAIDLVARFAPGRDGRATVVCILEPIRIPSLGLLPARARAALTAEAAALHTRRLRAAEQNVEAAVRRLTRAGWRARGVVRVGTPVPDLLRAAREAGADLIVVGARGAGGVERLLLGSVADAMLVQSPVSVLVAR